MTQTELAAVAADFSSKGLLSWSTVSRISGNLFSKFGTPTLEALKAAFAKTLNIGGAVLTRGAVYTIEWVIIDRTIGELIKDAARRHGKDFTEEEHAELKFWFTSNAIITHFLGDLLGDLKRVLGGKKRLILDIITAELIATLLYFVVADKKTEVSRQEIADHVDLGLADKNVDEGQRAEIKAAIAGSPVEAKNYGGLIAMNRPRPMRNGGLIAM